MSKWIYNSKQYLFQAIQRMVINTYALLQGLKTMKSHPLLRLSFLFYFFIFLLSLAIQTKVFAEPDFLEPEKAFQFSSRLSAPNQIEVTYRIADGYYMYHERFKFAAQGAALGEPLIPKGKIKFDDTFQKDMETFRGLVTIQIPILFADHSTPSFTFIATSQGCSDEGLCYVPMDSTQTFNTTEFPTGVTAAGGSGSVPVNDESSKLNSSLQSESLLVIVPLFVLLGLGLAFTPCVLPMVPILSSIIVGEGAHASRYRGLFLSLSYSLGMAVVYTALGIAAGLLGEGLAAYLQNPWVLGVFGLVLVGLSLSMFNLYHLQVPAMLQSKLAHFSGRQRSGKLVGVFIMGAISAVIIGPCVAAPLASALLYIGQTRNVAVGGFALFSMAIGMSVPLILVGLSAGTFLPRVGHWMESVKQLFGVLMLALALWLVSPVIPYWTHMLGWALLLIGYSYFLFRKKAISIKIAALILAGLGLVELIGVASGGRDVLAPLAHWSASDQHTKFVRIESIVELEQALAQAKTQGKSVMLDFYADWCVACKQMEKSTFTDARVQDKFAQMILLQVDVTANNDDDRALLKKFNLFGPPGIIFFGLDGKESGRVIGFQKADQFLSSLI